MKIRKIMLLKIVLLISLFCTNILSFTTVHAVENNRVVRVGYYIAPKFQDYDENNDSYSGSSYEYLMALKQYTNWKYEFVKVDFASGVKMLQNGELDLMNNVSKTKEREPLLNFSQFSSGSNYGCLIVNQDDEDYSYNDYQSFNNMKIGMIKGSVYASYLDAFCQQHNINPTINIYDNDEKMTQALQNGEIDTRVVSSSYNDGSRVVSKFAPMDYYFATSKTDDTLINELNDAMQSVKTDMPNLIDQLQQKYYSKNITSKVVLSEEEKEYLSSKPVVKVAVNSSWNPITYYYDDTTFAGPLADVYYTIEDATGLTFKFVKYNSFTKCISAIKNGKVDMIAGAPDDFIFAGDNNLYLTDKITNINFYRVTNENKFRGNISKVALYNDVYLNDLIKDYYGKDVKYVKYKSLDEAMKSVIDGKTDCTLINQYQSSIYQNRGKYLSLLYIEMPKIYYPLSFGININAPTSLKTIFSKGMETIDNDYLDLLFQMTSQTNKVPDMEAQFYQNPGIFITLFCIGAALVILSLSFIVYSNKMKHKNAELLKAKNAQSDFLSRMSHDMRTPMNGILGLATIMQDKDDVEDIHEDLQQLQYTGHYLLDLINDTLDMNKIEAGKLELHPTPVDIKEVVNNIVINAKNNAENRNIKIVTNNSDLNSTYIKTDSTRVERILINIISNAIKYSKDNSIVEFKIDEIENNKNTVKYRYTIKDYGIGISEEFLPYIFEPFSMEGITNIDRERGTGLGMSIVKQLIKLLNGSIDIQSTQNVGTTVIVEIPYDKYNGPIENHNNNITYESFKDKHILVCEDHPLNAKIITRLLEKKGVIVDVAEDGKIGVDMFKNSSNNYYDIILMDVRMPNLSGIEATQQIRKLERNDSNVVPIIAMTANAFDDDVKHCLDAGMNAHLSKPIDTKLLYDTLSDFL